MSFLTPFLPVFSFVGASLVTPASFKPRVRRSSQVKPLRVFQVDLSRFMPLHSGVMFTTLLMSKPPAPLNVCVIREVFFYLKMIERSLPAAPLNTLESLLRNSAGFLCPRWSLLRRQVAVISNRLRIHPLTVFHYLNRGKIL